MWQFLKNSISNLQMVKGRFAITAFREKLDLSQADLTGLFRLERSQIAHIESGNRKLIGDALISKRTRLLEKCGLYGNIPY
jgi:transcriptional regulator with XRE-family HTH domain